MHVTALLRDPQGIAAVGVPLTLVVERPDGVEYRRVDGRRPGRRRPQRSRCRWWQSAPTGTWRVRAFTDPKRPAVGEATFMVEDYVPDRLEFELTLDRARACRAPSRRRSRWTGRYLYGAPAAGLELEGEVVVAPAAERAGFAGYRFGLSDEQVETDPQPARRAAGDRQRRQGASFPSTSKRCRRRRVRSKRASPCGSPRRAAARSSASSRCR